MKYHCLKQQVFEEGKYSLEPLREEDMIPIMEWRNAQIAVLRQKEILTLKGQQKYFQEVIKPAFQESKPPQVLFSFLKGKKLIGYGGLTHIDWDSARGELSFLLNNESAQNPSSYKIEFAIFFKLLKKAAFKDLELNRIFTETFDIRPAHIDTLVQNGFILEGRLRQHVCIDGRYFDSLIHGYLRSDEDELA